MLQEGLYEKFGVPDYGVGLHSSPTIEAGKVGFGKGYTMANTELLDIIVYGQGAHGATPHMSIDPVVIASMIVMAFSRHREFRADAGGASLAGKASMIAALERLGTQQPAELPAQMNGLGISGGVGAGLKRLFMSHPPLAERIEALRKSP